MKTISIACGALMFCSPVFAGIDLSIEKDVVEIGVTASVTGKTYLFVGGDSDDWVGMGLGYHTFVSSKWKLSAYYEYGIKNDWLLNEMFGVDGVKTNTHSLEFTASRFFKGYSTKLGVTGEVTRNGFTWITVDDANKYSAFLAGAMYLSQTYLTAKIEYHYSQDKSDMLDFNQGQAAEYELALGTMRPIWHVYPYAKISAFSPNGTYYGIEKTDYSWTVGGRVSF